jgi:uncharacterized membrane-anchored protein
MVTNDFNEELHARPSLYFQGFAIVEHIAVRALSGAQAGQAHSPATAQWADFGARLSVERHADFVTVTAITELATEPKAWPAISPAPRSVLTAEGLSDEDVICRVRILVAGARPGVDGAELDGLGLRQAAGSFIGGKDAIICSDFRVDAQGASKIVLFNSRLNDYRLGRMVRRLCEIETYRSMALLGLPLARRLAGHVLDYDRQLTALADRHSSVESRKHRSLLEDITHLSAHIISDASKARHRFGATAAYAKIVEDRIGELREERLQGFQRYGVFIDRRFRPAVRTCATTASRLDHLATAAGHLIEILQTRIQVAVQDQNTMQLELLAKRAETQLKIQRSVEGLSAIAIGYYLTGLVKTCIDALEHGGIHLPDQTSLIAIPIALVAAIVAVVSLRRALSA